MHLMLQENYLIIWLIFQEQVTRQKTQKEAFSNSLIVVLGLSGGTGHAETQGSASVAPRAGLDALSWTGGQVARPSCGSSPPKLIWSQGHCERQARPGEGAVPGGNTAISSRQGTGRVGALEGSRCFCERGTGGSMPCAAPGWAAPPSAAHWRPAGHAPCTL